MQCVLRKMNCSAECLGMMYTGTHGMRSKCIAASKSLKAWATTDISTNPISCQKRCTVLKCSSIVVHMRRMAWWGKSQFFPAPSKYCLVLPAAWTSFHNQLSRCSVTFGHKKYSAGGKISCQDHCSCQQMTMTTYKRRINGRWKEDKLWPK